MKNIEIPNIIICSKDDPDDVCKSQEIDNIYRENAKTIVFSAAHVENRLASGIGKYYFDDNAIKHLEFDNLILSSDSFSFSAKRKSFLYIIKEQRILEGKELNELEKLISRVIRYRNMFTHGTPIYSGSKCTLHYFEGTKMEMEITDEYLEKVENHITECIFLTENLVQRINVLDT